MALKIIFNNMKIGFIVPDDYAEMGGGFSYKQTFLNYLIINNLKIGSHDFIPVFIYKKTILLFIFTYFLLHIFNYFIIIFL